MSTARTLRFPADVHRLAAVRDFAAAAARDLGIEVDANDLAVVVGELAANAAIHQQGEAEIALSVVDGGLQVEVRDDDPFVPEVVHGHPWDVEGHRGLFLIDALSRAWGVEPLERGKRVWAVLAVAGQQDPDGSQDRRDDGRRDDRMADSR